MGGEVGIELVIGRALDCTPVRDAGVSDEKHIFVDNRNGCCRLGGASAMADTCPPSPVNGATLKKLQVTNTCITDTLTVNGGAVVDAAGAWSMTNGTVHGGFIVQPHGELDIQATTNGAGQPLPGQSTVDGGIVANSPVDLDIWRVTVNGGITVVNATSPFDYYTFCAVHVNGGLSIQNSGGLGVGIGFSPLVSCTGDNSVSGSVTVDHTTLDMANTMISGSLLCINGGKVNNRGGNRVTGTNTCF
jgi:hypothetical protein